jgi:RNAse (barnase) inhibitor barstar
LEQESKRILQEASVIGRSFYYEILKKITELKDNFDKNLDGLERFDLIKTKTIQGDLELPIFIVEKSKRREMKRHASFYSKQLIYSKNVKWMDS